MSEPKPLILIVEDEIERRDAFRKLFEPELGPNWLVFAETGLGAIAEIRRRQFDLIFLDHDLGPDDITGADVAACVHRSPNLGSSFFVHSINPGGSERIAGILRDLGCRVVACAFFRSDFRELALRFVRGT